MPMRIGYARVSTESQNLARQIKKLEAAGCDEIFKEKVSGKSTRNRPALARALARLNKGDVFVVAEWDRATRSMMDGLAIMHQVHAAGATIKVLDRDSLDLTTPTGRGVLALLSGIYEEERQRIVKRAREGLDIHLAQGGRVGRKPKLSRRQGAEIRALVRTMDPDGRKPSYRRIAAQFGVHHQTISRIANRRERAP